VSSHGPIDVVRFTGELDIGRRSELREKLAVGETARAVLLDLSGVTYADSTALGELLRFNAAAEEREVPIAIVVVSPQLVRLIRYAGLYEMFSIFDDLGQALSFLDESS
jgi:anti-sigma B factor antagonist